MDIDYLYALQNLREGAPGILSGFLSLLSMLADGPGLVAIVMIVYWCVSKRAGQFTIATFMMGNLASQFIKNLACVYRPWIRDPRITPPESVLEGAGGYSFPSGHATGATTSLGSFAWLLRAKHLVWSIVLVVIVVLIAFSRNYLGVHTPQDVIVAVGIGVLTIWLIGRFFRWFEDNEDKDILVAVIAIAISIITLIIVMVKPYPLDYVDGKLLVDPIEMQKGSFEASGIVIGVVLGWLFERRMVRFSTDSADIDMRGRLIRGVAGVVIVGIVYLAGNALFKAMLGILWGKFLAMAVLTFVAMFVVPFVFTWLEQTRFVPYAGAPASRSAGSRSGRRPSEGRSGGRTSMQRDSRPSTGRSSSSRMQRSSTGRSRSRAGSSRKPREARDARSGREARRSSEGYAHPPRRPSNTQQSEHRPVAEPQPGYESVAEPQLDRRPVAEFQSDYEPAVELQAERVAAADPQIPQEPATEVPRRREVLGNLPSIDSAPASEPERPALNRTDLPSL